MTWTLRSSDRLSSLPTAWASSSKRAQASPRLQVVVRLEVLGTGQAAGNGTQQFGLVERLGQVVVGAERHAVAQVGALGFSGDKDEGPPGQLRAITENLEHPVTVEHRHHNVADD